MKLKLTVETGKHLPGGGRDEHGRYVAWAELAGQPVTGVLAADSSRDLVEVQGAAELARRLRRALDRDRPGPEGPAPAAAAPETPEEDGPGDDG